MTDKQKLVNAESAFDYIHKSYPATCGLAKNGRRILYTGNGSRQPGTIVGAEGARLLIHLDGEDFAGLYHPTWEITYTGVVEAIGEKMP